MRSIDGPESNGNGKNPKRRGGKEAKRRTSNRNYDSMMSSLPGDRDRDTNRKRRKEDRRAHNDFLQWLADLFLSLF